MPLPDSCAFLQENGSALPPDLAPNIPTGGVSQFNPIPEWQQRLRFFNFQTVKVVVDTTGAALATAAAAAGNSSVFPSAFRAASYKFDVPVGVFLFSFACSITSIAAGNAGFFCVKSNAAGLNLSTAVLPFSICDVVTQPNSLVGTPGPVVRNLQLALGEGTAMRFDNGDSLSIYACAPNDSGTLLTGMLTAYFINLTT